MNNEPISPRRWEWVLGLLALLIVPAIAIARWSAGRDARWVLIGCVSVSVFAFLVYAADKSRARSGDWRVPEWILHLLALAGGWPGAFIAQRTLRHKNAKVGFQIAFWFTVALHELVALDYLLGWQLTRTVVRAIGV